MNKQERIRSYVVRAESMLTLLLAAAMPLACSNGKTNPEPGAKAGPETRPPSKVAKMQEQPAMVIEAGKLHLHLPFLDEDEVVSGMQGTWVFDSEIHTVPSAWDIKHREFIWLTPDLDQTTKVKEDKGTLQILAPCKIAHVNESGSFSTATNFRNVVITDAGLFKGSAMGQRRGSDYVVCTSLGIFSGTSDACYLWTDHKADSLVRTNAVCNFGVGDDGAEYFQAQSGDETVRIPVFGDTISTWPLDDARARRVDGKAEATAAIKRRFTGL